MELGTLREISILRILRADNGHPNVVSVNSNAYVTLGDNVLNYHNMTNE